MTRGDRTHPFPSSARRAAGLKLVYHSGSTREFTNVLYKHEFDDWAGDWINIYSSDTGPFAESTLNLADLVIRL